MTRADVRTLAWLVPLSWALMIGWLFWASPCFDDEIAWRWAQPERPPAEVLAQVPLPTDVILFENPYGIPTCDYLPSLGEVVFKDAILLFIVMLLGFLCARHFQIHAARRAAVILFVAMCIAVLFVLVAYRWYLFTLGDLILLPMALVPAAIAWLSATLTLRWRRRA
jgi:hypothetical protein